MSFSFRNIFSSDESGFEDTPEGAIPDGFATPGEVPLGRGVLEGQETPVLAQGTYQTFLAGELLAFIPPAISARSGIPMEREVHVPVPTSGSLEVKLSTLYELCPELFAAEITPLNDSTVPLPPRLGATPMTASTGPSASVKGFSGGDPKPGAGNPFWSPPGSASPSPSAPASPHAPAATPQAGNPFSAVDPPSAPGPEGENDADSAKTAGGFDAPHLTSTAPSEKPSFGNAFSEFSSFGGYEAKGGGKAFGDAPPAAPPNHDPAPEGGSKSNPFEGEKGFSTLFSKQAEEDVKIPFPDKPIKGGAEEDAGGWGAMFAGASANAKGPIEDSGAAEAIVEEPESIGKLLKQGGVPTGFDAPAPPPSPAAAAAPPEDAMASFVSGFADFSPPASPPVMNEASSAPTVPEPFVPTGFSGFAAPPTPETKTDSIPPSAGFRETVAFGAPESAPVPAAAAAPQPAPPLSPDPFAAWDSAKPSGSTEPAVPEPEAPVGDAEVAEDAPVVQPSARAAEPSAPSAAEPGAAPADERDLELRAIFSTSEAFTLSKVARRVVGLPGIRSCSLSTPAKIVHASRSEENRLGNEAREMVATLRNLAKLTGLPDARTFTLQTDRGIVSLFLEGDYCVTVHHETADFGPGVREKLILVARSLVKLNE